MPPAQPIRRYLCGSCGVSGMHGVVPGPFRSPAAPGSPPWRRTCPSCSGELVDLSYSVARDYVEQAWEQDERRRNKIGVIVSAPLAAAGFGLGVLGSMMLTEGTQRIGLLTIIIPLFAAGALFTLSSRVVESLVKAKARNPDMSLAEVEKLEQIRRAEDAG